MGSTEPSQCRNPDGTTTQDENSYGYCGTDAHIYLGQAEMWNLYQIGDAAPALGIAHEWGHNVQEQVHVPDPRTSEETINHENQADCISGAWLKYMGDEGLLEKEDVGTIDEYLAAIAGAEGDPNRDHGTFVQRALALDEGWTAGLKACNSYYPTAPVYRPAA